MLLSISGRWKNCIYLLVKHMIFFGVLEKHDTRGPVRVTCSFEHVKNTCFAGFECWVNLLVYVSVCRGCLFTLLCTWIVLNNYLILLSSMYLFRNCPSNLTEKNIVLQLTASLIQALLELWASNTHCFMWKLHTSSTLGVILQSETLTSFRS